MKNYERDKRANEIFKENFKNLCRIVLTLNDLWPKQFYKKSVNGWFENMVETAAMFQQADEDDAIDEMVAKYETDCRGYTFADCEELVKILNPRVISKPFKHVLAHNIRVAFIQMHYDYGFGEERMKRLIAEMKLNKYPDSEIEAHKRFGIEIEESSSGDIEKFLKKKKVKIDGDDLSAIKDKQAFQNYLRSAM